MKTIILIEDGRTQLVLSPESDHDKSVIGILKTLPNARECEFYQTRGGWTTGRDIDNPYGIRQQDLAIVFDRVVAP